MGMLETAHLDTPIGILQITGNIEGVQTIEFIENGTEPSKDLSENTILAISQLKSYFNKETTRFSFNMNPKGTEFQQKVWQELLQIPFGSTKSYQQIANALGDPKVIRAAASANGKNPIAIAIPCHRVIGSNGSLTGYAGGLYRKKWLLDHESGIIQGKLF
ncbi:MAG: methylated-DNA--[protein]-cysteine S-methyltransferase [Marinirhabdus sp.]|nr:methylated-DNA--[protein]-cysteine S-methyltransferase [Marinirhabdus sp.]